MLLQIEDFNKIINHIRIKEFLVNMYNRNMLYNNLLFIGPDGSGHLFMALQFISKILNTTNYNHPDLHCIFPQNNKQNNEIYDQWCNFIKNNPYSTLEDWITINKYENKKYYININTIKKAIQKIQLKSFIGGYKIILIWMPEKLNIPAANKLLKILEEPTKNTLFILVGVNKNKIIPTILSRMQIITFTKIDNHTVQKHIINTFKLHSDNAYKISTLAEGNWNNALKIIKNQNYDKYKNYFLILLLNIISANKNLNAIKNFINLNIKLNNIGIEGQQLFIKYCIHKFRNIYMYTLNNGTIDISDIKKHVSINYWHLFIKKINFNNINRIIHELEKNYFYIQNNINNKIVLLNLYVKITKIIHDK